MGVIEWDGVFALYEGRTGDVVGHHGSVAPTNGAGVHGRLLVGLLVLVYFRWSTRSANAVSKPSGPKVLACPEAVAFPEWNGPVKL